MASPPHCQRLGRADEAPGLQPLCRARWRLGRGRFELDGQATAVRSHRGSSEYTAEEQAALAQLESYSTDASGYASIQGTRPQTLGYGLADSPVGQAMWIYEKFQGWTDNKGDPEEAISVDHMLDGITLYWLTDTAASSARLYYESFGKDFARMRLELP